MKKAKILIGISIVAALLVAMFAFSASAEAMTLKVELDKAQIEKGQEVIATVGVVNYTTALAGFTVTITYDAEALELKSVVPVDYDATAVVDPEDVADANGTITLVWITGEPEGFTTVNKLADLTFIAKDVENAVSGGIGAQFGTPNNPSEGMLLPGEDGAEPEVILPEDNIFSEDPADVPDIEVVPEGTLGGEDEPDEPIVGNSTSLTANGNVALNVFADYGSGLRIDNYRVDISWKSLDFVYTSESETWDPDTHTYFASNGGSWAADTISEAITVTNHSSQGVTVTAGYDPLVDVDVSIDSNVKTLTEWKAEGEDYIVKYDVSVDGALEKDFEGKLGEITITIDGIPENYSPVEVPRV